MLIRTAREFVWARVPGMAYVGYVRYRIGRRLKSTKNFDFPVHLSMQEEFSKEDVVLEAGANIGGNTTELAKYAKEVHAFEPSPRAFRWLCDNMRKAANVKCYPVAVSGEWGSATFNHQVASGSLFRNDAIGYSHPITVQVVGINSLDFNVGVLDAEGAEAPIMQSFKKWDSVKRWYVETHIIEGRSTLAEVTMILKKHYTKVWEDVDPGGYRWVMAR
jgi:FkbM family methyltransferase